jgi:hypothetical protein
MSSGSSFMQFSLRRCCRSSSPPGTEGDGEVWDGVEPVPTGEIVEIIEGEVVLTEGLREEGPRVVRACRFCVC